MDPSRTRNPFRTETHKAEMISFARVYPTSSTPPPVCLNASNSAMDHPRGTMKQRVVPSYPSGGKLLRIKQWLSRPRECSVLLTRNPPSSSVSRDCYVQSQILRAVRECRPFAQLCIDTPAQHRHRHRHRPPKTPETTWCLDLRRRQAPKGRSLFSPYSSVW